MALVTSKEMFAKAYKGGYAIGAFNIDNIDITAAVIEACEEVNSPVIIAVTEKSFEFVKPEYLIPSIREVAAKSNIPIVLHLDHGKSVELCKKCIDLGFTSVMIDASSKPFDQNVAITKEVVDYAHPRGVVVEGELGVISGVEDDISVDDKYGKFTHPADAVEFVKRTGVDSLAIAIGTAHGAYKFKPGQAPALRFDIVKEIQQLMPNFPLVLHGASSVPQDRLEIFNRFGGKMEQAVGVPEEMLQQAVKLAVCKINVGSDIRICYLGEVRKILAERPADFDVRLFFAPAQDAVKQMIKDRITNVLGSANKA